jgi:hypothetical protein
LGPAANPIGRAVRTARSISPSPRHGLKLLVRSWSAPQIHAQPDVYPFVAHLAERLNCSHVIALGHPTVKDLRHLYPKFELIGFTSGVEVQSYRNRYPFGRWLDANQTHDRFLLPEDVLRRSLIVCSEVHQSSSVANAFNNLRGWMEHAPLCILTSPDRDRNSAKSAAKWNLSEFEQLLRREEFDVEFIGWTASDNVSFEKSTMLAVVANHGVAQTTLKRAPENFRVVAFMAAYNEEDIIVQSIQKWTDQGVAVHVLENWSTDRTYDLAKDLTTRLPVTVERFPASGPSKYFDWEALLKRIEVLSKEIDADWFVRRGADEVLASPWPGITYRDALFVVDRMGFNCVDHTIVEFHPIDDGFKPGMDHEAYFRHFDFKNLSHSNQRKAWKNVGQSISTIASAGHDVMFQGRRVYPFKFLLKHYAFRSQQHGEKKVFVERKARWNPEERAKGWHVHYDAIHEGHRFVQSASEKVLFEEHDFNRTFLVERLAGIGTQPKQN